MGYDESTQFHIFDEIIRVRIVLESKIKIILVLCAICLLGTYQKANSQAALLVLILGDKIASENFHLSLDGGINVSNMNGFSDGKALIGPNFGLGVHIKLNENWYLAPEFKPFSIKGVRDVENPIDLANEFVGSEIKSKIILSHIEIPLLIRYRLNNGLYFSGGPQVSFLTYAHQKTNIVLTDGTIVSVDQDLKNDFESIDFSFPLEIGYAFKNPRGGKGMDIRVRYSYGFNEIFDSNVNQSANHSTFQFILAFPFVEHSEEGN